MFRAEVIGSLLRPSYLKEARAAFEQAASSPRATSSASRTAPSTR